jgi:hypothetical protein
MAGALMAPSRSEEHDLHTLQSRVSAEFRERLFSIEAGRCERVLGALVDRGVLATDGRAFASADAGERCV